jgi:cytochrome c oxidase subunit 2
MALALLAEGSFWLPEKASTFADQHDALFYFILGICAFFTVLVTFLMFFFAWRYRWRPDFAPDHTHTHHNGLELTWTIVPTVILVAIFGFGFSTFLDMMTSPEGAYEIRVTGRKWSWSFEYPTGKTSNVLHVPKGQPVRLVLQSQDVIHSVFVPAFRVKRDVVPGRLNKMWFEATKLGEFPLYCAEYCGTNHSQMNTTVRVQRPAAFDQWVQDVGPGTQDPVERGRHWHKRYGCQACHSLDGSSKTGPTWKNLFGSKEKLSSGETVTVNEAYVRESIMEPGAKITKGYGNVMPKMPQITDDQINDIIALMKSVSKHYERTPGRGDDGDGEQASATQEAEAESDSSEEEPP